jgi:hypothetical protein
MATNFAFTATDQSKRNLAPHVTADEMCDTYLRHLGITVGGGQRLECPICRVSPPLQAKAIAVPLQCKRHHRSHRSCQRGQHQLRSKGKRTSKGIPARSQPPDGLIETQPCPESKAPCNLRQRSTDVYQSIHHVWCGSKTSFRQKGEGALFLRRYARHQSTSALLSGPDILLSEQQCRKLTLTKRQGSIADPANIVALNHQIFDRP